MILMECSPLTISRILGKKWNILILQILKEKSVMSFNELKKEMNNITSKILSTRLQELQQRQLLIKERKNQEKKMRYNITEQGREILELFNTMRSWAVKHHYVPETCLETKCKDCIYNNCSLLPVAQGTLA